MSKKNFNLFLKTIQTIDIETSVDCASDRLEIDDGAAKKNICGAFKSNNSQNR